MYLVLGAWLVVGYFFVLLKKVIVSDTFKPLVHGYLRGSGWKREKSRAQHSKEIMSYINN